MRALINQWLSLHRKTKPSKASVKLHTQRPFKPQLMDVDDKMKVLMAELSDMRGLLEEQLAQSNKQGATKNPVKEAVKTRLAKLGLSKPVSTQILAKIKPSQSIKAAWSDSLTVLSKSIPVCGKDITDHRWRVRLCWANWRW